MTKKNAVSELSRNPTCTETACFPLPEDLVKDFGTGVAVRFHPKGDCTHRGGWSWGEAEADVVVAVIGTVVVPVRRATVGGIVVPRAAAVHAVDALDNAPARACQELPSFANAKTD